MALTKFNYNSFDVTPVASKAMGFNSSANGLTSIDSTSLILIKTLTASSSSTLAFVDGTSDVVLDDTYPIYIFKWTGIHPSSNGARFNFNVSIDSGSNYNVAKTSTFWNAYHTEDDTTSAGQAYNTGGDLAQGTGAQNIFRGVGAGNDEAISGELWLFNPSSTTYSKHYYARSTVTTSDPGAAESFVGGYANTTSAVDALHFLFHTGNIDAGTIKLYGIKDS